VVLISESVLSLDNFLSTISSRAERLACDSVGGNKKHLLKVGIVVGIVRKG
jgi:hypothetical protein